MPRSTCTEKSPAGKAAGPGMKPRPVSHGAASGRGGDNFQGRPRCAASAGTLASGAITAAMAWAQRWAMAGDVPVATSASVHRLTAQRRWWPLVARRQAWPQAVSALIAESGRTLALLQAAASLARHINQRSALGVPRPSGVGHAVPAHVGAQLFARVPAFRRLLERRASIGRDAAAPPLDDRRRLAIHQPGHCRRAAQVVDDVFHPRMLGQPSVRRKPNLAALALGEAMKLLSERLQAALDRNPRLSQAGLHRATGASTASVSNWFTGKSLSMKAANLRTAASYLGCSQHWLETGLGDPRWTDGQHSPEGLQSHTVAHDLSHPKFQSVSIATSQVPVIGTLATGAEKMFELRASPDGKPIGFVPAGMAGADSYALQVFGDELYPAVRHGTCIVVGPKAPCTPGELVLLETSDGNFMVCELVTDAPDAITWTPAAGGQRKTMARSSVAAMHPIVGLVPGSRMKPAART